MKSTTRGSLAAVVACMASAVAAAPAVADSSVPVTVPLESLETVLPVEAPKLRTGVPLLASGVPDGPRYVTGRMLPHNILPAVPIGGEMPETLLELPVKHPLGEGDLGVGRARAQRSDVELTTPGATLGGPLTTSSRDAFGLPDLTRAALSTPVLRGTPVAGLLR
ncbi:hypothetical protein [Streptomyces sp. NPDC006274]|uniref:hypothetical protein n=1 Tax=unclassified Streptomyces TaxID=2593676 RepID=UPI0033A730E0